MDFNLPVAAYPGRSLMLQAFTGVSKVEKAQRNRCQTSPSKFGQRSQQTNRRRGSTASPALGSGRIFPVSEESIAIDAVPLARHWPQIGGPDFGWDHPTAAAKLAWDRDSDVVYVTATYRMREATPLIHAGALKPWGTTLPWAWPHDGLALRFAKPAGQTSFARKLEYPALGIV
jgi:Terminase RNaseH-like domain